jgi:hypothetical protein
MMNQLGHRHARFGLLNTTTICSTPKRLRFMARLLSDRKAHRKLAYTMPPFMGGAQNPVRSCGDSLLRKATMYRGGIDDFFPARSIEVTGHAQIAVPKSDVMFRVVNPRERSYLLPDAHINRVILVALALIATGYLRFVRRVI